jgi:uncharacterized phage protein gp47/JayE
LTPGIIPAATHITVETERDIANDVDESVVANEVKDAVRKHINARKIGKSVLISDLIVVLKRLSSLSNVRITYPVNDIIIQPNQIARYADCVVTVET